jgi:hypothetical protein
MAGVLYPETEQGILSQPATVNPILLRQIQAQRAANPRPNVTDLFGYGPDLNSYTANLSRNFAGQFEGLGTPQNFMGPLGFGGITAFHGSPHKFDKFDMSKVGTGEGAQAYGHGLYFAENPGVAKSYREMLTKEAQEKAARDPRNIASTFLEAPQAAGSREKAISSLQYHRDNLVASRHRPEYDEAIALLKGEGPIVRPPNQHGALYKVDIPDDQVAKMLDWDKPLSQQPESVRKALADGLENMGAGRGVIERIKSPQSTLTGKELYEQLQGLLASNAGAIPAWAQKQRAAPDASAFLNQLGIPGIRYLDQGSRSGGKGTSNFVVFDDQIPKIIGRE